MNNRHLLSFTVLGLFLCNSIFSQKLCNTQSSKTLAQLQTTATLSEPCKLYWIRVYVHRINGTFNGTNNGYSNGIENTIINNLNNSFNTYGIFFELVGSRTWYNQTYSDPATTTLALPGIITDPNNGFQSSTVNIYVLPANSQISGGFVPSQNKQIQLLGGTRTVNHCQGGTANYTIADSKITCHEMGHNLGLVHTFENNGDDGLSDTQIDYVTKIECTNPSNCQFTGTCGGSTGCTLATNPTTSMTNFMAYTIPNCMTVFSPMQVNLMRNTLNNSLSTVVSKSQITPDLMQMKYDNTSTTYTVNGVVAGYHTIQTNVIPLTLTSPINWTSSNSSIYWGKTGSKYENGYFSLNSGQSTTFTITANNICGSASRNTTYVVQSAFRIFSSTNVKDDLTIEFDNIENLEALPESIIIYDEKTTKEDKSIIIKEIFDKKQFVDKNKLIIDVRKLSKGNKILHFNYLKYSGNDNKTSTPSYDIKVERIIIAN